MTTEALDVRGDGLFGHSGAVLSADGRYRYRLWRTWDPDLPRVLFVMCNPSTADELHDDPTIRRCVGFAKRDGFGSLEVVNLFAYRTAYPAELHPLHKHGDPVGPSNDEQIAYAAEAADTVVAAWGVSGGGSIGSRRKREVCRLIPKPLACLGWTANEEPRHPLYVPATQPLCSFTLGG